MSVELLRPEQAAEEMNISRTRIFGLIASGELRSIKLGKTWLIPRECIREFVERQLEAQAVEVR